MSERERDLFGARRVSVSFTVAFTPRASAGLELFGAALLQVEQHMEEQGQKLANASLCSLEQLRRRRLRQHREDVLVHVLPVHRQGHARLLAVMHGALHRALARGRRGVGGLVHLVEKVLGVQRLLVDLLEVEGPVVERLVVVVLQEP